MKSLLYTCLLLLFQATQVYGIGSYTSNEGRWEPTGWVYHAWPYAYDSTESRWHFFNESNTQWRVNTSSGDWRTLDAATGWNYYAWPYSYSVDQSAWHWYNNDTQWVVDLVSGVWKLFGAPPTLAPYTLEPGTVVESVDTITFVGSNNDFIEFYKSGYDGVGVGSYSYSRTDETRAAFAIGTSDWVDIYGGSLYPAASYTLNFTSETAFRASDGKAYNLYASIDLAPTSLAGLTAATDGYGYSNFEGGYTGTTLFAFRTASSGTLHGNLTIPFNYTYEKVGPREGRLNGTSNDAIYGSVNASYVFHFLTVSSGYFVGVEQFSNDAVEYEWGTFRID